MNKFIQYCNEHGLPSCASIVDNYRIIFEYTNFVSEIAFCFVKLAVLFAFDTTKTNYLLKTAKKDIEKAYAELDNCYIKKEFANEKELYDNLLRECKNYLNILKEINKQSLISKMEDI